MTVTGLDNLDLVAAVVAVAIWALVVLRAVQSRADLEVLALLLIMLGFLGTQLLAIAGVRAPFAWAFCIVGVVLLILWPRHDARSRKG